jgi:hypothetical protein
MRCPRVMCGPSVGVCARLRICSQGLFGTLISTVVFGLCTTFPGILSARLIWGALNGNIGISTYCVHVNCCSTVTASGVWHALCCTQPLFLFCSGRLEILLSSSHTQQQRRSVWLLKNKAYDCSRQSAGRETKVAPPVRGCSLAPSVSACDY